MNQILVTKLPGSYIPYVPLKPLVMWQIKALLQIPKSCSSLFKEAHVPHNNNIERYA
jgi:hypothetical protein